MVGSAIETDPRGKSSKQEENWLMNFLFPQREKAASPSSVVFGRLGLTDSDAILYDAHDHGALVEQPSTTGKPQEKSVDRDPGAGLDSTNEGTIFTDDTSGGSA